MTSGDGEGAHSAAAGMTHAVTDAMTTSLSIGATAGYTACGATVNAGASSNVQVAGVLWLTGVGKGVYAAAGVHLLAL